MSRFIRNPFQEKSTVPKTDRDLKALKSDEYVNDIPEKPNYLSLDGDICEVHFPATTIEDLRKQLINLLEELDRTDRDRLDLYGIRFYKKTETPQVRQHELILQTPKGAVVVFVDVNGTEIDIYRRLGYVLSRCDSNILAKHRVTLALKGQTQ